MRRRRHDPRHPVPTDPPPLVLCAPRVAGDREHAIQVLTALADGAPAPEDVELLDPRSHALVRVGGLIAAGACAVTCAWAGQRARQAGATNVEVAAVLVAIGAPLGESRLVEAAPRVAAAIGYDLAAAFEGAPSPGPASA